MAPDILLYVSSVSTVAKKPLQQEYSVLDRDTLQRDRTKKSSTCWNLQRAVVDPDSDMQTLNSDTLKGGVRKNKRLCLSTSCSATFCTITLKQAATEISNQPSGTKEKPWQTSEASEAERRTTVLYCTFKTHLKPCWTQHLPLSCPFTRATWLQRCRLSAAQISLQATNEQVAESARYAHQRASCASW